MGVRFLKHITSQFTFMHVYELHDVSVPIRSFEYEA
jgi:hypothetical protein